MAEPQRLVTLPCPTCGVSRVFRVVSRAGRLRMLCPECEVDLPASLGRGAQSWRDLVDGPEDLA